MKSVPTTAAALLLALSCASWGGERAPSVRMRLEWGGGASRTWTGRIELDEGRFQDLQPLGVDAGVPGAAWIDGRTIHVRRRGGRIYDGLDVTALADPASKVKITLESDDEPPLRSTLSVALEDVATTRRVVPIGDDGDRVSLQRAPGDTLSVDLNRSNLVLDPGESFECGVTLNVWTQVDRRLNGRLRWAVVAARGTKSAPTLMDGSQRVVFPTRAVEPVRVPLRVTAPADEGVYDLRLVLEADGMTHERLVQFVVAARSRSESRSFPVADTSEDRDPSDEESELEERSLIVDRIDSPATLATRRFHRRGRLQFVRQPVDDLARLFDESADARPDDTEWVAMRMSLKSPTRPHRLVVTLDASTTRTVGISILQPNAAGRLVPVGLDGGVDIAAGDAADTEDGTVEYALEFQPRTRQPVVLLHTKSTEIGVRRIELVEVAPTDADAVARVDPPSDRRLVGPYVHRPLISETLGVGEALDPGTDRSLDDWVTFDTAARELARHVQRSGGNACMLTVMADGGTIFPSSKLEPTLRSDTGQHFSSGQDPVRKDVCELLLRRFDEESLSLLPVLRFSARMPGLEELARTSSSVAPSDSPGTDGDDAHHAHGRLVPLVDSRGRSAAAIEGGPATPYDPLDPAVQSAVIDIVREFAERYAGHPALAAVVVDLGRETCLNYPGDDWGYADEVVERFVRETGVAFPAGSDDRDRFNARVAVLRGAARERWLAWREERLHAFHVRIAEAVTAAHPKLECVLLRDIEGADPRTAPGDPGGLPPRTRMLTRVTTGVSQIGRAGTPPGQVSVHPPDRVRIAGFDEVSPWQPATTWLAPQATAAGVRGRQPLVVALAGDAPMFFEGGWTCLPVVDDGSRELRTRVATLPRRDSQLVSKPGQPVVVRTMQSESRTWLYVANTLEHAAKVRLRTRRSGTARVEGLDLDGSESLASGEGTTIPIALEPFDLVVMSIDSAVVVEDVDVQLDPEAELALRRRLRRLDDMIARLRKGSRTTEGTLENPGFEVQPAGGSIPPGWTMNVEKASHWRLDHDDPRSGRTALNLSPSDRSVASVASEVPLDGVSRVIVSAWMRSESDAAQTRLVFETVRDGRIKRRYAPVKATREWNRHAFRISDFAEDGAEVARVRFEVMGPTPVWIDDVSIELERISRGRMRSLEKTYAAASLALDESRYADAARLLDDTGLDDGVAEPARTSRSGGADSTPSAAKGTPAERVDEPERPRWWPFKLLR